MKNKKIIAGVTAAALSLTLGISVWAASTYDSSVDPIITYSFFQAFEKKIYGLIEEKFAELTEKYGKNPPNTSVPDEPSVPNNEPDDNPPIQSDDDFFGHGSNDNTSDNNAQTPTSSEFKVVELKKGDALYAVNVCELILRSGQANCIAPDANQGIADLTSGSEIYNGEEFSKNHHCMIPRGDGRGILASSESVFIMIKGDYTIVEN